MIVEALTAHAGFIHHITYGDFGNLLFTYKLLDTFSYFHFSCITHIEHTLKRTFCTSTACSPSPGALCLLVLLANLIIKWWYAKSKHKRGRF